MKLEEMKKILSDSTISKELREAVEKRMKILTNNKVVKK
jgi:uncharacterized protein (UPF0147 family)